MRAVPLPLSVVFVLVGGLCPSAHRAAAQTRAEAVAFGAYFQPLRDVAPGVRHRGSPMLGLRVGSWVNPRLGFEGSFAYANSNLDGVPTADADVIYTTLRGRFLVTGWTSPTHVFATLGFGWVSHAGPAYNPRIDVKDFVWSGGAGGRFQVKGRYALRVEVESYFHRPRLFRGERHSQSDLVLSVGFAVGFGPGWPGLSTP